MGLFLLLLLQGAYLGPVKLVLLDSYHKLEAFFFFFFKRRGLALRCTCQDAFGE